jgi:hypothetical protein
MVFSAVSGVSGPVQVAQTPSQDIQITENSVRKEVVNQTAGVEQYVRAYFADVPIMVNIAYCESRFRQFDKNGDVFRGAVNNQDVGVMQINEHYHLDTAQEENYNLYSAEGNVAYARKLYEKFGTDPWNSSKPCWGKMNPNVATTKSLQLASANVN